jgi:phosphoglucomutase
MPRKSLKSAYATVGDLCPRFDSRLIRVSIGIEFGTAGLRGRMAAGFSCMNSLTVIQASQGLAKFIRDKRSEIASNGVVIGHDARHNSARFAALAANAFIAQRIPVWFFEKEGPTPMVPFGVNYFHAAGGIMVTASHVGPPIRSAPESDVLC